MPPVSKAQARAMYAAAAGHSTLGISQKVGKEFTGAIKGKKGSVKKLPARKRSGLGGAMAKHLDKHGRVEAL